MILFVFVFGIVLENAPVFCLILAAGGDDRIPLFAPGKSEPDLRQTRPLIGWFDASYMATSSHKKVKRVGAGIRIPGELRAHLKREAVYKQDVHDSWDL